MKVSLGKLPLPEFLLLSSIFAFISLLDSAYAVSLSWVFCFGVASLALFLILPGYLLWQRKKALWLFAIFGLSLVVLHFIALTPVKPFTKFHNDVTNGMTGSEVQLLLTQHFPQSGKFRRPVPRFTPVSSFLRTNDGPRLSDTPNQTLQYTLDPSDGRYNAECVMIYLKDDRVVGTQYLGD